MANFEKARKVFDSILNADGAGIVVTDENLLAEHLAEEFDCTPSEIYDNYESSDEE